MLRPMLWVIVGVLACAGIASAQVPQLGKTSEVSVVTLADNEVLIGDVIEHVDTIEVSTRLLGTLKVLRSSVKEVRRISSVEENAVANAGVAPFSVSNQTPRDEAVGAATKVSSSESSSFGIAKLKISTAVVASLQRDQNYAGEIDFFKNWNVSSTYDHGQRTWLLLSPSYDDKWKSKHPSSNVTQVYSGSLQHSFLETNGISVNLLGHAYHNNTQGIFVEQAYAVGISKDIDTLRAGSFEFSADLRAILQTLYSPGQSANLVGSSFSLRYYKALPAKLTLQAVAGVVPVYNNNSAWESSGLLEISYPITAKVAVVAGVVDNYYEIAPKTFNKNYMKSTLSIQYTPAKPK